MPYDLATLGFDPFFAAQVRSEDTVVARVAAEHRGRYQVWSSAGETAAQLAGRLMHSVEDAVFPGVGDWVTLKELAEPRQDAIIDGVLSRRTVFIRGAAGREARGQVVAANVDLVFVVCGLDGDYSPRRIERYLARIWASGAQPVVVLNKADVCDDVEGCVAEVQSVCLEAPVLTASALRSDRLEQIRDRIGRGITAAFVGSSGAGKSTLINSLLGEQRMATAQTRARDGRGCHTTTHRQLIVLPGGGLLIDTPGMRELQLVDEEGIDAVFTDIAEMGEQCRFGDCRHETEPGCAVREAVKAGAIQPARLAHYQKLEAEARAYEQRHDERARRQADRAFGRMVARDGDLLRRLKQGK